MIPLEADGADRDRSRVCVLHKSVASQPMSIAHPSCRRARGQRLSARLSPRPMTVYRYARVSTDGQIRQHREKSTPQFLTGPSSKRGRRGYGRIPPRSGRESFNSHKADPTRRWLCLSARAASATPATWAVRFRHCLNRPGGVLRCYSTCTVILCRAMSPGGRSPLMGAVRIWRIGTTSDNNRDAFRTRQFGVDRRAGVSQ
jgi:hypothetical protein